MDGGLASRLLLVPPSSLEVRRRVLTGEVEHHSLPPGGTIAEALAGVGWPPELTPWTVVVIEGHEIAPDRWHLVRPREGMRLLVALRPAGGGGSKGVMRLVATLAIAVAVAAISGPGGFLAAPIAAGGLGLGTTGAAIVGAGLTLAGSLAVNALIGTPKMSQDATPFGSANSGPGESQSYGLSGAENAATPYRPVPRIYGRHRMTPPVAAETFVVYDGAAQTVYALLDFGYGPLDVTDIRIGDTPIGAFPTAQWIVHPWYKAGDPLYIYTNDQAVLPVGAILGQNIDHIRVAPQAGTQINIDLLFPGGLVRLDDKGQRQLTSADVWIAYRVTGEVGWRTLNDARATFGVLFNGGTTIGGAQSRQTGMISNSPPLALFDTPPRFYRWMPSDGDVAVGYKLYFVQSDHWATVSEVVDSHGSQVAPPGGKLLGIDAQPPGLATNRDSGPIQIWQPNAGGTVDGTFAVEFADANTVRFWGSTTQARSATVYINSPENQTWEILVARTSPDSTDLRVSDDLSWASLRIAAPVPPILPRVFHTILELRVTASAEISGQISRINALCTSYLTTWAGGENFPLVATRNPAWVYADVLRGTAATKTVANIDWEKLKVWADYCDGISAQGDVRATCDIIVDSRITVGDLAQSICTTGRAAPSIRDGKYSVITEAEARVPVQLFTSINARGFNASRIWIDEPHALNVRYLSEETWQRGETIVYADGYGPNNASKFETLELIGVTRPWQAWRAGRYYLAAGRLRKETMEIEADIESIVCQRGDLVLVQHDRLIGGDMARVAEVISPTQIKLDFQFDAVPQGAGMIIRRLSGGVSSSIAIQFFDAATGIYSSGAGQSFDAVIGDLVTIGQFGHETTEWLVDSVMPGPDLTARLRLIEARPEILSADSGPIPPYVPPSISNGILLPLPAIPWMNLNKQEIYQERMPFYYVVLTWGAPSYAVVRYDVFEWLAGEWIKIGETTAETRLRFYFDRLRLPRYGGEVHTYGVRGVSTLGRYGPITQVSDTYVADTTAPPALILSSNVMDQHVLLSWLPPDPVVAPDLARFEVRWTPRTDTTVVWGQMNVAASAAFDATQVTINANTGTYAVAAIDTSGNVGDPAYALVLVETLADIDIIQEIRAAPAWDGRFDRTEIVGGELRLAHKADGTYEAEGWFYSNQVVLFPEPWKLRLYQYMDAYGFDVAQVIASWVPIAMAIPLDATSVTHDWDAQIWIARRDDGLPLADAWYTPLATAVPLAGPPGSYEQFSNLFATDVEVARLEWAIRLTTKQPSVTPSVIQAGITVDMRERREWDNDVPVPAGGLLIPFGSPFFEAPALAITLNNGAPGDRLVRSVDRNGFDVEWFSSAGASVARTIDWQAIGYGKGV